MKHAEIDAEAARLQQAMDADIDASWESWSRLATDRMLDMVAEKHLDGRWEYMKREALNGRPGIAITRYIGEVE